MKTSQATIPGRAVWFGVETGLFFLLFFAYVWLVIDPRLIHHSLGVVTYYYPYAFHTDWPFFREHLARSGGLVEYAAQLGSQGFALGWLGALVLTGAAWCACLATDAVCRRAGLARGHVLRYVPAVLVLAMYGRYAQPLGPILALLAALAGYLLYACWAPRAMTWRLPVLLLSGLVLYHMAGAGSLLFLLMVALDELLIGGRKLLAAVAVAWGGIVPWAVGTLSGLELHEIFGRLPVLDPQITPGVWRMILALYLFFPTVLAGAVLWSWLARRLPRLRKRGPTPNRESRWVALGVVLRRTATVAFFVAVAAVVWYSRDPLARTLLEIDYHAQQEHWAEVLQGVDRLPPGFSTVRCHRNLILALYHTGRLGDDLFRYPHRQAMDVFATPEEERDIGTYYQDTRLFLDLGYVNDAERCAYEALAVSGDQPEVLEQLAVINVVKGRPDAARIFLRALAKHPFHRQTAEDLLRRLETDDTLASDPRVSRIHENMVEQDRVAIATSVEAFFTDLLEKNPRNPLAFQLMMAYYLVARSPDKVVANLPRLKDLSYSRIPRLYQEAWVVYAGSTGQAAPIPGFRLDPEVERRAWGFQQILASAARPQDAAKTAKEMGMGDTYFYYLVSGVPER